MGLCILASACTTPRTTAPVVERAGPVREAARPAPAQPVQPVLPQADAKGFYTVRRGDTLFRIALDFGQNYRDIVAWNNLSDPNDIKVNQVLRVLPPDGITPAGSQTETVANGVEVRPLPAPVAVVPAAPVPNKSGPRAEKRPYSEANLAELQRPESSAPAAVLANVKVEPVRPPEPKPGNILDDKPAAPTADNGSWIWPAEGKVLASFDENKRGIDIAGKPGQDVLAASSGKVMYAGSGIRGYGNLVIVKHSNNLLSAYAHNRSILVKEGQSVTRGQKIAEMGNSDTDAVKLHFEIRQQGKPVDPSKFLPAR